MDSVDLANQELKINRSVRTFVLVAIGLAVFIWNLSFNFGVYGTVFYDRIFTVWVICSVVLAANFFLPAKERYLNSWGMVAMLAPTLWFILQFWQYEIGIQSWLDFIGFWFTFLVMIICLPYGAYIIVSFTQSEALRLKPRSLFAALAAIAVTVAIIGYTVGANNYYFMTCTDFEIAGSHVPENCFSE